MKKCAIFFLSILVLGFSVGIVSAASNQTGYITGPSLTAGYRYNTQVYNLTTQSNSVTGTMVNADIKATGNLPSNFANSTASNRRNLVAELWEYDVAPNEDDLARTYTCPFDGKLMQYCANKIEDYGNLDSSGDKTVEMFLSFKLTKLSGDPSTGTGSFFKYNIEVA